MIKLRIKGNEYIIDDELNVKGEDRTTINILNFLIEKELAFTSPQDGEPILIVAEMLKDYKGVEVLDVQEPKYDEEMVF